MLGISTALPDAQISKMEDGEITPYNIRDFFKDGVNILVGVPGAFTPICTNDHLPTLIASAGRLKDMGVQGIYCISDDNPWALDKWAKTLEGHEKITFLCDGNRDFLDKANMVCDEDELFLNGKYARFYAIVKDGIIKRVRFETSVLETVCTRGDCIEEDVADYI